MALRQRAHAAAAWRALPGLRKRAALHLSAFATALLRPRLRALLLAADGPAAGLAVPCPPRRWRSHAARAARRRRKWRRGWVSPARVAAAGVGGGAPPPPPPRTKWTRRVPHPVLIGHAAGRRLQTGGPGRGAAAPGPAARVQKLGGGGGGSGVGERTLCGGGARCSPGTVPCPAACSAPQCRGATRFAGTRAGLNSFRAAILHRCPTSLSFCNGSSAVLPGRPSSTSRPCGAACRAAGFGGPARGVPQRGGVCSARGVPAAPSHRTAPGRGAGAFSDTSPAFPAVPACYH